MWKGSALWRDHQGSSWWRAIIAIYPSLHITSPHRARGRPPEHPLTFLFAGRLRGPVPEHAHVFPGRHRGARETVAGALGLTAAIGVVEVIGALVSNSLSLQGDAAHNFIDTTALGIALASLSML